MRPPFNKFPVLDAGNLRLRQILPQDCEGLVEISTYEGKYAEDVVEAVTMNLMIHKDYEAGRAIHWGIALLPGNEVVGTCGFYRGFEHDRGEIGFVLREEYQGMGIMFQAMQAVLKFGFSELQLREIFARTETSNIPSHNVLRKLGFKTSDNKIFTLTRSEFQKLADQ